MKILIACETSGIVRRAFAAQGHQAWSCDVEDSQDNSAYHIKGDVREVLNEGGDGWDMMIAHPPCTYLCGSGMHWTTRGFRDPQLTEDALELVQFLLDADIKYIALENPVGCISTRIRKPDQYIQPYQFGNDASKKTGLWLKNLPKLTPTEYVEPRILENGLKRWSNQTPAGQDKTGPSPTRSRTRSNTYQGIADAMADQWNFKS